MFGAYPDYDSIVSKKVELLGKTIQVQIWYDAQYQYCEGIIENVIPSHTKPIVDDIWIGKDSPYVEYYMRPTNFNRVCFINKGNGHHITQPVLNNIRVKVKIV